MDITITPGWLRGEVCAIPSKSHAHRLLICAALAEKPTDIICPQTNLDIEATIRCLNSLGARIVPTSIGYHVFPIENVPQSAHLNCAESASTLRFLLPIVGALGIETTFSMHGSLASRPILPLWEELENHGCTLVRTSLNEIQCSGQLMPGKYVIDGAISSQFISGLLLAMAIMNGRSQLTITGNLASKPYIKLTQHVLKSYGVESDGFTVIGRRRLSTPQKVQVEGDWSNAAFFIVAQYLGNPIHVSGLDLSSQQGDKAILEILQKMQTQSTIDITDIPDLFPVLAITAGASNGAEFINIARLQYKESDRVSAVTSMLVNLGATVELTENRLKIEPARYHSCSIDSHHDHRIAMAAAIAATVATGSITIRDAECVAKSYPSFWEDYRKLGGNYEQYIQ